MVAGISTIAVCPGRLVSVAVMVSGTLAVVVAGGGFVISVVVTAAGTSVAEIAAMGLMALVVVIADNQTAHMQTCPYPVLDGRKSLPEDIGQWVKLFYTDGPTSDTLARTAREIYDGQGCARILDEISALTVPA